MPTEIRQKKSDVIVGKLSEFVVFVQDNPPVEQAKVWHLGQEQVVPETKGTGINITLFTPMHEVKFTSALWEKLDKLSAQTPDPVVDEDDGL